MAYRALKGVKDILPMDSIKWQQVERIFTDIMELYGYLPVRVPIIEETALFTRSVGDTTDIVEKQMYTFKDKAERSITLRPEATASVVRAYIENGLYKTESLVKFYYMGPMFRNERPQAGRARQFHQLGVEVLGASNPYIDCEVIALAHHLLKSFGLEKGLKIKINSLGTPHDKEVYANALKKVLEQHVETLCPTCQDRLNKNVFRILDCKNEGCKKILEILPPSIDSLCEESRKQYDQVIQGLDDLGVPYVYDPYLVRGLDYYTHTAFEITHENLGAQDAIGAGGRYDELIHQLEGPQAGAVGFALGMERIMLALKNQTFEQKKSLQVYVAHFGGDTKNAALRLVQQLRSNDISAVFDFEDRALKKQFAQANKLGVQYVITIGEDELTSGMYAIKNMETSDQQTMSKDDIIDFIIKNKI